jgi:transcriptional regulator with XRE-family HTH domain
VGNRGNLNLSFGRWLRLQIEKQRQTQGEFAARAGIRRDHLNAILHDRHTPRGITRQAIAEALGVDRSEVEAHLTDGVAAA